MTITELVLSEDFPAAIKARDDGKTIIVIDKFCRALEADTAEITQPEAIILNNNTIEFFKMVKNRLVIGSY